MENFFGLTGRTNKPLVEFKAGKMMFNGSLVTPDKRKGLIQLTQAADSLIHFIWKDRTTGVVEDDLIIFPEEATYKKVKSQNRIFLLEFKDSSKKHFFWMQEPSEDKDEEYLTKINQFINNPPNPEQSLEPIMEEKEYSNESPIVQPTSQQLSKNENQNVPQSSVQLRQLQNILSSFSGPNLQQNSISYILGHNLSKILDPELLLPLMSSQDLIKLVSDLPTELRTLDEVQNTIRSPQFQQTIQTLSYALESGQLNDLIQSLNLESLLENPENKPN